MTDTVLKLWRRTVVELVRPQIEELEHDQMRSTSTPAERSERTSLSAR